MIRAGVFGGILACIVLVFSSVGRAEDIHLQIRYPGGVKSPFPPAVVWLKPLQPLENYPQQPHKSYTLVQKNRSFSPHLLVVPVGSQVQFPNEDPFYHNVFSLFDGQRFDLGLYEAGSSRTVTFSREGASYIFCNIHPEMSAVVIALATPYYATADSQQSLLFHGVPPGDYELHAWIEGIPQPVLNQLTRRVHIGANQTDLGSLAIPVMPARDARHLNLFGQPYDSNPARPY